MYAKRALRFSWNRKFITAFAKATIWIPF